MSEPITETWLRDVGFKWGDEFNGVKHWILWMGGAVASKNSFASEDLGVEVAKTFSNDGAWHCWIRADYCGRYSRFVHIRYLRHQHELTELIAAMTGFPFDPANSAYGSYHRPEAAERLRGYRERLEVQMAEQWGQRAMRQAGQDPNGRDRVTP